MQHYVLPLHQHFEFDGLPRPPAPRRQRHGTPAFQARALSRVDGMTFNNSEMI